MRQSLAILNSGGAALSAFLALASGCAGGSIDDGMGGNASASSVTPGTVYELIRSGSAKCLDVKAGGSANGTAIQQLGCDHANAQHFRFDTLTGSRLRIVNPSSNRCVDVKSAGTANGTPVQLYDCNGSGAQAYTVEDVGGGYVRLRNVGSNRCLDVSAASSADGARVQIYDCNSTAAQSWKLTSTSGTVDAGAADGGAVDAGAVDLAPAPPDLAVVTTSKKGLGLPSSRQLDDSHLSALGISWYYDWNNQPSLNTTKVGFVPLIFSPSLVSESISGPIVLGYNEPDNMGQANVSVSDALLAWPQVVAKAPRVGAPAMAGNPVTGAWFPQFMASNPKVDFIPIHWYKGPNATLFIQDVTRVINTYHLPVWITEFAPQTISQSTANPTQYTQDQVDAFIAETVAWMEQQPEVERYAWHDSKSGTSSFFDANGNLTATALSYARAH